jgi:segregation and condensation protein B
MDLEDPVALRRALEALVFLSPGGVPQKRLVAALDVPAHAIAKAMEDLIREYKGRQGGVSIVPVAGGWQMVTATDLAPLVEKFLTVTRKKNLSPPAMETLSIVAYRQPVTKPEIEAIRGVDSGGVLNGLLEKRLVRLAGRKKVPGKPLLYATTREFLLQFGLRDLRDLPALGELGRPPGDIVEVIETGEEEAPVEETTLPGLEIPEAPAAEREEYEAGTDDSVDA